MTCKPLTSRERLRRAYCHEEMDRPAVFVRTSYPPDDPTYDRLKAFLAEHGDLKAGWSARELVAPYPTSRRVEPYSDAFAREITLLHTPAGDLESSRLASLTGQPGMEETYFIKSPEDAAAYLSLPLPEIGGDVEGFFATDRRVGDRGIADVGLGFNPGGTAAELCGSETFALLSVTDREVLHALCERAMTITLRLVTYLLERGVGPFFYLAGEEYLVPPLHGPRDFADFNTRYDRPIIDRIHEGGGRVHIHSHGRIAAVLDGFLESGVDVLHPFEPPPLGDITAAEAKARVRGRVTLEGNLQIHHLYEHTPEEIRAETGALIADAFDDRRGLIVCPTASPYIRNAGEACFPQFAAMVEAVLAAES